MRALFFTIIGNGALSLTVDQGTLNILGNVTGTIESGPGASGVQIFVQSPGSITAGSQAVVLGGTANSLFNAGTIKGAILATGSGSSILNLGLIENPNGVAIVGGDGAQQVKNDGVISSGIGTAIDFGGGDDLLQLSTTARIGGSVLGGAGFDTLLLTGAGNALLDLHTFDAFERLQKNDSGLWMLTGSNDMPWNILAGGLVLRGDLTGPGFVQAGALLAGNGQVGGFTNAGTVSPGMSIGAIGVVGDYVQLSTGTLEIETSVVPGFADRLNVTGRAMLDGTLALVPEARPFGIATEHTILQAQGGVAGTFASTTSTPSNLDTYVDYLPQSVLVTLVRNDVSFARMAGTENLRALGESLDASKRSMARGDFKVVMDQFLTMDAGAQASALRTLSGELHATLPTTLLRTGERFFSASATRRVNAQQAGERATVWTDLLSFNGDVRGEGHATGLSYGASGLVGGVDVSVGRAARLGGSLGYARATNELDAFAADNASVRSLMPAVYGEANAGAFTVEGAFGYGEHDVRTTRSIQVGAVARQAYAAYKADQYSGLLRLGVAVPPRPALLLVPFVELRYSNLVRRAFDEAGAESANLTGVGAFEVESFRTLVGMRTAWTPLLFGKRVEPMVSLAWTHEGLDTRSGMLATLSGVTARPGFRAFMLGGVPDARNGALINASAAIVLGTHGRAFVAYDGLLSDSRTERGLQAGGRIVW
jgi:subtilase-type serine protease